jgi:hypothetical protein
MPSTVEACPRKTWQRRSLEGECMRTELFLGVLTMCVPLFASRHIYNEHEITPDEEKRTLPNSEKLHEKIGKKGFKEKQYATLTFRKKTSEPADLTSVVLQWKGPHISQQLGLSGALFHKKNPREELIATHDNQVATSAWNEKKQQLIFHFKKSHSLSGTTKFFVVLTVNQELDSLLQNGSFSLLPASLPDAFQTTKKETSA